MTPVEERIDHERGKVIAELIAGQTEAEWVQNGGHPKEQIVARHYLALLTEHFAREQRIAYFVNLYPSFKDYFRDHFLPATEPAQPEEEPNG